jgi:hypothetical protein
MDVDGFASRTGILMTPLRREGSYRIRALGCGELMCMEDFWWELVWCTDEIRCGGTGMAIDADDASID